MGYIGQVPTAIPLTSADIADGTIALADMAVNSIDSDQYVDGSIDTAHIATNQIDETLIKDAFVGDFSDVTVTAADAFLYGDATDSGNTKKDTIQGVLDLVPAGGAWTEGCFADLSVDKTVANSTGTQVQLDRESFDIGSNFNTSTYLYTIPSDGYYFVHWQVGWGVPGVGRYESWITKNDVQAFIPDGFTGTGNRGTGEAPQINMWTTIAQFAEDDYLKLWAWHNSGSTQTLHMNASAGVYGGTWLNVWKVSGL